MKEIVEGLRGPALGVVVLIIILAGTIVTAAFAALIAQMGLLMRLRSQDAAQTRANSDRANKVVETRRSTSRLPIARRGVRLSGRRKRMWSMAFVGRK